MWPLPPENPTATVLLDPPTEQAAPPPSRLDVVMGALAVLLVGGFFLDLWAHSHGRVDDSFFTPWHAVLYAAAGLHGGVLFAMGWRGRREGQPLVRSLPPGYGLSFVGSALFLVAGLIDLVWHEVVGFEVDIDALLSPSHLLLATAGILMVTGPLRSAWARGVPVRFPGWLPWVLGLTMAMSIMTSFTEYAHPAIDTWPASVPKSDATTSELLFVSVYGATQTRLPLELANNVWLPDYAPDGERLVVSAADDEEGSIFVIDLDGSAPQLLFQGPAIFNHAVFSPNGSLIAFTGSVDDGNAELFVIPATGGEAVSLTDDLSTDWGPTWSPDGSTITFVSDRDGDADLYTIPASGGEAQQLTNLEGNEASPDWSPDGTRLAFDSDADGDPEIYQMNADGSGLRSLTANDTWDTNPTWSPAGDLIAFASDRDRDVEVYVVDTAGGSARNLTRNPGAHDGWAGIAWSPDGQTIVTNTSGWEFGGDEPFFRQALGISSLLIQAALIAGVLVLMLRMGPPPSGALTVLLTINAALMTVISDNYWFVAPALLAGVTGDILAARLATAPPVRRARILSFVVPALWYALYLVGVHLVEGGIGWSLHMTLGAPLLAGIVGLLMSFVAFPGHRTGVVAAVSSS